MTAEAMAKLDELRPAQFRELLGSRFTVVREAAHGGDAAVELVGVEDLMPHQHRAEPFSLVFRGAAGERIAQGIHRLAHDRLGILEVFLVPIRGTAATIDYEAIFN